jgi:hypothetical protein
MVWVQRALLLAVVAVLLVVPALTFGSSGGLDRRGGHHCWTSCASKGYYTGQYHCHRRPCGRADVRKHRGHGH